MRNQYREQPQEALSQPPHVDIVREDKDRSRRRVRCGRRRGRRRRSRMWKKGYFAATRGLSL
jgi:hypothetical protein